MKAAATQILMNVLDISSRCIHFYGLSLKTKPTQVQSSWCLALLLGSAVLRIVCACVWERANQEQNTKKTKTLDSEPIRSWEGVALVYRSLYYCVAYRFCVCLNIYVTALNTDNGALEVTAKERIPRKKDWLSEVQSTTQIKAPAIIGWPYNLSSGLNLTKECPPYQHILNYYTFLVILIGGETLINWGSVGGRLIDRQYNPRSTLLRFEFYNSRYSPI